MMFEQLMWYRAFSLQDIYNFAFFMTVCVTGCIVLIRIFTPPYDS